SVSFRCEKAGRALDLPGGSPSPHEEIRRPPGHVRKRLPPSDHAPRKIRHLGLSLEAVTGQKVTPSRRGEIIDVCDPGVEMADVTLSDPPQPKEAKEPGPEKLAPEACLRYREDETTCRPEDAPDLLQSRI